jgi:hypothetical protein
MQKLEIYQSLWAMELRSPVQAERTTDENFAMVAEAGFDGMCIDFGADEILKFQHLRPYFEKHELGCMVNAFPGTAGELEPILKLATDLNACMTNVIGGVMPLTVDEVVPVIYRWMDDAEKVGMQLLFETHRDSTLNDLFYTLQLIEAVPEMRLCADLSHFVIDREFRVPIPPVDQGYIDRILERSDCFQGRIAGREQIQLQVEFPQHQEWVKIFRGWWKMGMRLWRQRNNNDATLRFLCELGPPPYAITDGDRLELSDRWDEALQIKVWVESIWAELAAEVQS